MSDDTFSIFADIGEVAGILRDIAAREISESKPIAGTAVDMLARLIEDLVARGLEGPEPKNVAKAKVEAA
ncbi:MAG: hypothetical protein PHI71_08540 [Acidiphilium sp.]|jgi:sulfur transfer complex TusBCD TusB component (DsrH family)|nr:hypothetical protein [Acidiphilium sp.]